MAMRKMLPMLAFALIAAGAAGGGPGNPRPGDPFRDLAWRNIGPSFCGGRVVDIEGYEGRPGRFWAAAATGGLWRTDDNGRTWRGCFDREATASIGDIAVSQRDENLVWLGSGESNAQAQSYPGRGVFKSTDGGRSWRPMGLVATRHIARVLIDPGNDDTVYVAAAGALFSPGGDRGVYKTTDGGRTWEKALFISENTGVIDLAMDARDSRVLYAASWQRRRKAWDFSPGGPESGIYKTTDGGRTWTRLAGGLPEGPRVGRIGLAVSRSDPAVVYALIDSQEPRESAAGPKGGAKGARQPSDRGVIDPSERRNDLNVIGAEVFRSADAGASWRKVSGGYIPEMYYSYGFYFGQVRVAPDNADRIYVLGVSAYVSEDGGRTFARMDSDQRPFADALVHRDHHALWVDPRQPRSLVLGNDGGINLSADGGRSWSKAGGLSISQCYTIAVDDGDPASLFTGTQDNGVLVAPRALGGAGRPPQWHMLLGGDGAFVSVLPGSPPTLLAAAQFGSLVRIEAGNIPPLPIKPRSPRLLEPYRFNWLAPLLASRRRRGEVLFGAERVLRSLDRGSSWQEISPDLSEARNTSGDTPFATITALAASESAADRLYAGTDDGNVWVKAGRDAPWRKISQVLPRKWVSRIVASRHSPERVYLLLNGRVEDDDRPYLFYSENSGFDWEALDGNLPDEPLNALAEDPENEDILYLGGDRGLYVSLDAGSSWLPLQGDMPVVPVNDLLVEPRARVLVAATFGRGVYVLPLAEIKRRIPGGTGLREKSR
jgi:photosystem II stability/assembly factor-like uncharacterized protein